PCIFWQMSPSFSLGISNEWFLAAILFILIGFIIAISEILRVTSNISPESNRKVVHLLVGSLVTISPFLFQSNRPVLTLAGIFCFINLWAIRSDKFQGMHTVNRVSYGTVFFPVSFFILTLFWWTRPVAIVIAIALMTFADTIAAITGEKLGKIRKYKIWEDGKSVEGSLAMYLSSFILVFLITLVLSWYTNNMAYYSLTFILGVAGFTALIATIAESLSKQGSDNLSVPIIFAITFDQYLVNFTLGDLNSFIIWAFVSLIFLAFAYRAEALTGDGAVAAYLIGLIIFGSGGWSWIIPLLIFLVSSSLLAKYQNPDAPGSKRNISQVFANGSVALTIALLHFYLSLPNAFILYLAAIAAATADTWATEIGFFSLRQPVSIATLKKVEKGSSGGITLLGTTGSVIGAAVIGLTGMLGGLSSLEAAVITVAGFTGSILDSILGATIQGKFQCPECNKITEKRIHCGIKSIKIEGFAWLDNNLVNFINTAGGIITVILIFSALK
ncbi:MAG: DUF92 domain-containing protein, partial [Candidatus Neomarinimicrobiota bacterium]